MKIGLISDTHGLLRPEALAALQGCDHLVHAGDIGKLEILDALRAVAPLTVVRGNNDRDEQWAGVDLNHSLRLGEIGLYVTHEMADVPSPLPLGIDVVVTGHSHKPLEQWRDNVLFINPGSAGPRRFKLPITVALLQVDGRHRQVKFVALA
ncbi:metallophosphoesterase family protein [Pseudomonas sp. dw_358]|uniref:metallophosphoesterase family protein n=1 Tax=Pseudomonas sp. dw_358 TaxID=2720083 RepID=UPI001BD4B891|nr:metallophosphoesterase family protein [Pseudomonas sp. dw_358]